MFIHRFGCGWDWPPISTIHELNWLNCFETRATALDKLRMIRLQVSQHPAITCRRQWAQCVLRLQLRIRHMTAPFIVGQHHFDCLACMHIIHIMYTCICALYTCICVTYIYIRIYICRIEDIARFGWGPCYISESWRYTSQTPHIASHFETFPTLIWGMSQR